MTPTERAKRSDALYYETASVNRRVLCDMIANREADLEDARAENAKMREEFNKMDVWHSKELTAAMAENAKLRELLTFYLGCLTKGHVNCDSCAFAGDVCEHGRKVIDWARELRVEVEE